MDYIARPRAGYRLRGADIDHRHYGWLKGIIPKVVNDIMSFTIMTDLKIEQRYMNARYDQANTSLSGVYDVMCIIAPKIYIARSGKDDILAKGISYVRRSGSMLRSVADKNFIDVVINTIDTRQVYEALSHRYGVVRSLI
jgi:hypothetical protein